MREFIYAIDSGDRITRFNEDWVAFARENDAAALPGRVLGTDLYSHIEGAAVRDLYRWIVARVRSRGGVSAFPYRCDSPALRRFMEMRVEPAAAGGVEFRSRLLRTEDREPVSLCLTADPAAPLVTMCAWCKRVRAGADWLDIEAAIRAHGGVDALAARGITHGMCEPCARWVEAQVEAQDGGGGA